MLAPARGFYTSDALGKDEVRIAYAISKEDLAKALLCCAKLLRFILDAPSTSENKW